MNVTLSLHKHHVTDEKGGDGKCSVEELKKVRPVLVPQSDKMIRRLFEKYVSTRPPRTLACAPQTSMVVMVQLQTSNSFSKDDYRNDSYFRFAPEVFVNIAIIYHVLSVWGNSLNATTLLIPPKGDCILHTLHYNRHGINGSSRNDLQKFLFPNCFPLVSQLSRMCKLLI